MYAFLLITIFPLRWNAVSSFMGTKTQITNSAPVLLERIPISFHRRRHRRRQRTASAWYNSRGDSDDIGTSMESRISDVGSNLSSIKSNVEETIMSPVLRLVYPDMLLYIEQYGHPNIPLDCEAGRQCATLRRLRDQDKLVESDLALLDSMKFMWHSLEDVYTKQKEYFGDFIQRLQKYQIENDGDISPPKKYKNDPELGAWVTAVRRLYTVNEVDDAHVSILNELDFQWNSPRKCGSKFMQQYRTIQERMELISSLSSSSSDNGVDEQQRKRQKILNEPDIKAWIQAQQMANLSETRKHYMSQLVGDDWMNFGQSN
jgi:hypothetical protein